MNEIEKLLEFGIIILDKPIGPTSHKTTDFARRILQTKKAGHSGTLDPKVSGVLPIALNKATRILEVLLIMPKEYVGVMHLHEDVSLQELKQVIMKKFLGKIKQIPPKKSAVVRKEREREVYEFEILEKEGKDVLFKVKGQAGLYVRKLIHDLGIALRVGAHMLELRRIAVGNFTENSAVTLYELASAYDAAKNGELAKMQKIILPIEAAVQHLSKIYLREDSEQKILHGQYISAEEIIRANNFKKNELTAGFIEKRLICLFRPIYSSNEIKRITKRDIKRKILRPEKVFV